MNAAIEINKRHWFQFSLKTFLIIMTALAIGVGLYAKKCRDRKAAVVAIKQLHGVLGLKYFGPAWLRKVVRDDEYFYDPTGVAFSTRSPCTDANLELAMKYLIGFHRLHDLSFPFSAITDAGLAHLRPLNGRLTFLNLSDTNITDAGMTHLKSLTSLKEVRLERTHVTAAGVAELQMALPNCKIQF